MAYCTETDITKTLIPETVLAQLTDDTNGTTVDSTKVAEAISQADEIINGYLRARYALPLSITPDLIKNLSVDIAAYNLYSRRIGTTDVPEVIESHYRDAVRTLEKIQRGMIDPGIEDAGSAITGSYLTNKTSDDPLFSDVVSQY